MTLTLKLTPAQAAAVNDSRPRVLLLAPAGSGKTEVLTRRVERILEESADAAFRILAVTYTVKAAEELRTRLQARVAEDVWRVDCDTLHSFALEWLTRYGSTVGVRPGVIVFSDDADRLDLISGYLASIGIDPSVASRAALQPILNEFDAFRTSAPDSEIQDRHYAEFGVGLKELYDAYLGALQEAGGIDFPGMLCKLSEALDADPWVRDNFYRTYQHVLVDEGQDLTRAQALLLQKLVGPKINLFVVADDRQSINEFAGGAFENARMLVGESAPTLSLHDNFRCALNVLQAAEKIAAQLASPQEPFVAPGAPPGKVEFEAARDSREEASRTLDWVNRLLSEGLDSSSIAEGEDPRVKPEDIAVIARTRWLLEPTIQALKAGGHELSLNLETSGFLANAEGRVVLEALALLVDARNRPAHRRLVEEIVGARGVPLPADSDDDPLELLARADVPTMRDIAEYLADARPSNADLDALLGQLDVRFAESDWSGDATLISGLWRKYRSGVSAQHRSMIGFLRFVGREQLARPTDPGIRVLTIHRVKGLEFKAVALVGVYDGALPDYRARTPAKLNAERRSLYVAMTRARRMLRVSWPAQTFDRSNRSHSQQPSRFLEEAGLITNAPT